MGTLRLCALTPHWRGCATFTSLCLAPLLGAAQRTVTQPDAAHFTSDGEWLCSGACGSGWRWHRADRKRHAMCSKPPGLDLYNWSAVRVFVGEHGGSRCGSWPPSHDEVLLAAVEGDAARIVRVNPRDGSEATELGSIG